jgi:hypothetical protein
LLVSWCAGDRCDMAGSGEDHGRSRGPGPEDLCAVCTMHKETSSTGFFGLASKARATVSPGLASKPGALGFPVWSSKLTATVW